MAIRAGLLNGNNINQDYDFGYLLQAIATGGYVEGLEVTSGLVGAGKGFVPCERTNGNKPFVFVELTDDYVVDTTGTKKVWIEIPQAIIDDGALNPEDGTGTAEIKTGASYPAKNYIPLASITGGTITDEREKLQVSLGNYAPFAVEMRSLTDVYNFTTPTTRKYLVFDFLENKWTTGDIQATDLPSVSYLVSSYIAGEDLSERNSAFLESQTQSFDEMSAVNDAHTASFGSTTSNATAYGLRCKAKKNIRISTVTKSGTCSASGCYLKDSLGVILESVSFVGNVATFNTFLPTNFEFAVEAHSGGSAYTVHYYSGAFPAHTGNNVQFTAGSQGGGSIGSPYNILSVDSEETVDSLKIGNIVENKRVALRIIGSDVSDTVIRLMFSKKGTPPANLNFRLESETAGEPSGLLIDNNGTFSISQAQLTNTNFKYKTISSNITDTHAYTMSNVVSTVVSSGFRLYAKKKIVVKTITKDPSSSATYARLKTDDGVVVESVLFVGNVATLSKKRIINLGDYFRVELDNNGASYTQQWNNSPGGYPINKTNVDYVTGSLNGVNSNYFYNIVSITTDEIESVVFAGSVLIPRGTKAWLVGYMGTYGAETTDANNYYQIGLSSKHTNCNVPKYRDGTSYLTNKNLTAVNDIIATSGSYQGTTTGTQIYFRPKETILLKTITLSGGTSLTITGEGVNFAGTFSAGVATINVICKKGYNYNLTIVGAGIAYYSANVLTMNNISLYSLGNNVAITFNSEALNNTPNAFPYLQANLYEPILASKTDAKYSYKIDFRGFVNETKVAGDVVQIVTNGVKGGFSNKTVGATQYISNTPGEIIESAGTNSRKVGKSFASTEVQIVDVPL